MEGSGHAAAALDVRNLDAQGDLIARTRREFGNVYVLAHLAAVLRRRRSLAEITEEDWDLQIDTNLKATFFLCRAAADAMQAQGQGGRIIATGGFLMY